MFDAIQLVEHFIYFILEFQNHSPNMDCNKENVYSKKQRHLYTHTTVREKIKSRLLLLGQNQDALSLWCFSTPQLAFQRVTIFIANGVGIEAELRRHPDGYVLQSMSMVVWWGDHTINHQFRQNPPHSTGNYIISGSIHHLWLGFLISDF